MTSIKDQEDLQTFVFFETFSYTLKRIKDPVERCKAYDTLVDYWLYWKLPDNIDSERTQQLMENAVPLISAAKKRRTASVNNWKKWGAPKWNQNAVKDFENISKQPKNNLKTTQKQPKNNPYVYVYDNVNVDVNDNVYDNVYANAKANAQVSSYVYNSNSEEKETKTTNKTKNNNELIGNMVWLQEKTNSLIDSNVWLQEKNEANINEFDIKKKEEKDSAEKEERTAGAEQPAADAPSLEEAMDYVISVVKNAVERKWWIYNPNNERKFAKEILTSEEIRERRLEHYKPTLKEFLEATVYNSYVSYNQYIKVDSLFRLFYSYQDIYNNAVTNEWRKTAIEFYFFHLPSSERQKKHNAIAKFISEKVPLPW